MTTFKSIFESTITNQDRKVVKSIEKSYPDLSIRGIDAKRKIVFEFNQYIDDQDFDNFGKIDSIMAFLKKSYKGSIVTHDGSRFTVEEL